MNFLAYMDQWVSDHRPELARTGELFLKPSPKDVPKRSLHLIVRSANKEAELILWESGEAEFNRDTGDEAVDEHVDLLDQRDLDGLLRRFLAAVDRL